MTETEIGISFLFGLTSLGSIPGLVLLGIVLVLTVLAVNRHRRIFILISYAVITIPLVTSIVPYLDPLNKSVISSHFGGALIPIIITTVGLWMIFRGQKKFVT